MKNVGFQPFPVRPGSLIGHPVGLHHTLIASDPVTPIKWYCIALNTRNHPSNPHHNVIPREISDILLVVADLTDPDKPYLELLEPELAKQISETSSAAVAAKANL